ncbi:MAG: hypothetical protein WDM78_20775 [Puia sp.]
MKANKLIFAGIKAILCMGLIFLLGFLGYHNPDAMVWVVAAAIFLCVCLLLLFKGSRGITPFFIFYYFQSTLHILQND